MSSEEAKVEEQPEKKQTQVQVKHDWYQTETYIVINILAKGVDPDKVKICYMKDIVDLHIILKDGNPFSNTFHLAHGIVPEKSTHKVLSTKVEIRLMKNESCYWSSLENEEPKKTTTVRNWDKVVSEIGEEQPEGEAALNALFQKIYSEGSDEVKKAMNKSFMESGGTELNTNWDAVKKGKVSIKPPDGMEWKSWEQ
jgi:suppressor of G2 allele of SKP1